MHNQHPSVRPLLAGLLATAPGAIALAQDEGRGDPHHEIDEITVTATPLARTVEQLAQPTAVLSGDELTRKQAASIGETVSQEIGVNSTYFGPVSSRPVIRGQYGERVRVLSNGLDTLDASALSEDHQTGLDSILSQRIEIIRGPATLLYGSGAAGGLVNVVDNRIIQSPLEDSPTGTVVVNSDSAIDSAAGAGRIAFGNGPWNFQVDAFRRTTDDIEIPGFAESAIQRALEEEEHEEEEAFGLVENSDSETNGAAIGASYVTDRGYFGFSVESFDSNYGVPGHAHEHAEEEPVIGPMPEPEEEEFVRIDLEQLRVAVRGDLQLDGPIEVVKVRAATNDYEHTELEGEEVGTVYENSGIDTRLELHHRPSDRFEGALGFQYKRIDLNAVGEEAYVPASDTRRTSFFAFEEMKLSDSLVIQGSFRAERQTIDTIASGSDYSDTAFGVSVGTVWNFRPDIALAANLSITERHPNATELYADGPHVAVQRFERGSVVLGDGILDMERTTNLDVTLRGDSDLFEWTVTGFINDATDYILLEPTSDEEDGFQVFEYQQGDVDLYGAEVELRMELFDAPRGHLHGRLFGDFVHAEESVSGEYVARIPPLRIGGGLHYTLDALEASVEATWHDDQRNTAPNELPTDGYTLLSAEISYFMEQPGVFVYLRGANLTDEDARQHTSPLKDTVPLPGRALQAGLRWDF